MLPVPVVSAAVAVLFVGLMYLTAGGRGRDDPTTILRRGAAAVGMALLSWVPAAWQLRDGCRGATICPPAACTRSSTAAAQARLPAGLLARLLGFPTLGTAAQGAAAAALLVAAMYMGPLTQLLLTPGPRRARPATRLVLLRNLVVSPVVEELVFRGGLLSLWLMQGWSPTSSVLLLPLFFGTSHLHHLYELAVVQRHPVFAAAYVVVFQLFYTTVFGWFAAFLLLRTGTIVAPIVAHVMCNHLGLPSIWELSQHPLRPFLVSMYLCGIVLFAALLSPVTAPERYGGGLHATVDVVRSVVCSTVATSST